MARTPSAQAHSKVLEASLELFAEHGIDATSMDAIAEASGVSKATIYKHWPDKAALALEALALLFGLYEESPKFDSGDLRQDFVQALTYQPTVLRQEMKNRIMPHVMAYAARNTAFGETWRSRIIERPRTHLKMLLKRGVSQGVLVKNIDVDTSLALLLGPSMYWYIFVGRKSGKAMPVELATEVVSAFWKAYGRAK
jgi:AcrR family transcriptional regulator